MTEQKRAFTVSNTQQFNECRDKLRKMARKKKLEMKNGKIGAMEYTRQQNNVLFNRQKTDQK